ncbi:ATP-binding cassette domain-containing protein, partial [Mesorhizobium sp. M8A.F.Ca.ET.213.01.1.1]
MISQAGIHASGAKLRRGRAVGTAKNLAIMGDNGAGKSTFVRQITGVEQ